MEVEPLVELRLAVAALPTDTVLLCENTLPDSVLFVGLLDRGTRTEEKVLCYAHGRTAYVQARGWDGTRASAHFPWKQSREALAMAYNMAVHIDAAFGRLSPQRAENLLALDPDRLKRMEELVFAPVHEWVAEGEARAVREFELA